MIVICHLLGFRLDPSKEIKIDDTFLIRKLSFKESKLLREKFYLGHQYFLFGLKDFQFCVEIKNKINKKVLEPVKSFEEYNRSIEKRHGLLGELHQKFFRLIVAMWLYSGKAVTMGGIFCYDPENINNNAFSFYPETSKGKFWKSPEKEIENFKKFWNVFSDMWFDSYDIVVWYFKEAMHAKFIQDRLLKLTIAMDKILTPDGTVELRERFSTRAAVILEKEIGNRKDKKKFFKDIYSKRSGIVHGSIPIGSTKVRKEDYNKYFDDCRKLMCLYIENYYGWEERMKEASLGHNKLKQKLSGHLS